MLAGMMTCSRRSVQVRPLKGEATFSITGKCCACPCGHTKDVHIPFFRKWQAFFPSRKKFSHDEKRHASLSEKRPDIETEKPAWRRRLPKRFCPRPRRPPFSTSERGGHCSPHVSPRAVHFPTGRPTTRKRSTALPVLQNGHDAVTTFRTLCRDSFSDRPQN